MTESCERERPYSSAFLLYLVITAVVCGGLVMVIEVLGSRVIGPFFGVSLFVWTSLITVTLVTLALGYTAGGIISDRKRTPDTLYSLIMAAGGTVLLIPLLMKSVLTACLPLGLRAGALVSSFLLFGPPLLLLGCVSPYIIKIAVREMKNVGRTVGVFYAISTMGSCIGTVVTGFLLIGYFGVVRIFHIVGIVLVLLSVIYFFVFARRRWSAVFLLIPAFLVHAGLTRPAASPDGARIAEVAGKDSYYGKLKVVDFTGDGIHIRRLFIDGLSQGGIDMKSGLSVSSYHYLMELLPYSLNPEGKSCLVVGLGAGLIPMWYEERGIRTDVVDINPDVVTYAKEHFGFAIGGDIIISDARYYLAETRNTYDYVIMDVFNGDTTPGHMLSMEALRLARERMTERGILAVNLIGSVGNESFMTASIIRTLEKVFTTVDIYLTFSSTERDDYGNLALIAYNFPAADFRRELLGEFPIHPLLRDELSEYLDRKFTLPERTRAIILTDDYNPIDFFDNGLKEKLRMNILMTTSPDLLL